MQWTASNGDPQSSDSLHHIDPTGLRPNQYQRAIDAVGNIIEDYDSDKAFPVLGYGARLPPTYDQVSHLFFVNGSENDPFCYKVKGLFDSSILSNFLFCLICMPNSFIISKNIV